MAVKKASSKHSTKSSKKNVEKMVRSIDDLTVDEKEELCDDELLEMVRDEISKTPIGIETNIKDAPDKVLRDIIINFFLVTKVKNGERLDLFEKHLSNLHKASQFKKVMDEKEDESKFSAVLKTFDYVGWLAFIWIIILILSGHSSLPFIFRFIICLYFIYWLYSVIRSTCKNVDLTKKINKLLNAIIYAKMDVDINADKERISNRLDLEKILSEK